MVEMQTNLTRISPHGISYKGPDYESSKSLLSNPFSSVNCNFRICYNMFFRWAMDCKFLSDNGHWRFFCGFLMIFLKNILIQTDSTSLYSYSLTCPGNYRKSYFTFVILPLHYLRFFKKVQKQRLETYEWRIS